MRLRDSLKQFNRGLSKCIAPERTFRIAYQKLRAMKDPVMQCYLRVSRPSGIPQTRFIGTPFFRAQTMAEGTNGKGSNYAQAKASGIMEMVERYSCNRYFRDRTKYRICPYAALDNKRYRLEYAYSNFTNPPAVSKEFRSFAGSTPIRWYKGYDLRGGKAYIPAQLLRFALQGTNGWAAGNSLEEALLQAVCEVIERHCMTILPMRGTGVPEIDATTIDSPLARALIRKFTRLGQKISIFDFSCAIGVPVIGVARAITGRKYLLTAGASSSRTEALIRALTENSQSELARFMVDKTDLDYIFAKERKYASFLSLPDLSDNNIKVELLRIGSILEKADMRIFFCDATDAQLRIPSVAVFISNAKYHDTSIAWRNFYLGLVEEAMSAGKNGKPDKYITAALRLDKSNAAHYECYRGASLFENREFAAGARSLEKSLRYGVTTDLLNTAYPLLALYYACLSSRSDSSRARHFVAELSKNRARNLVAYSWLYRLIIQSFPADIAQKAKSLIEYERATRTVDRIQALSW